MSLKEKFEELNKQEKELTHSYYRQLSEINSAKEEIMFEALAQAGHKNVERYDFELTGWECENSPIGECIGNTDTQENECIFCGGPEERK
jgi:hypothetical protein